MFSARLRWLSFGLTASFLLILVRLFYWQILAGPRLQALGLLQYQTQRRQEPGRGQILSADDYPLAINQTDYSLYVYKPALTLDVERLSAQLAPYFLPGPLIATAGSELLAMANDQAAQTFQQVLTTDSTWVPLAHHLDASLKARLEALNLPGLSFEANATRLYPEASLAAQLIGFVGSDEAGYPRGYFGLEGFYHRALSGEPGSLRSETDLLGRPIIFGAYQQIEALNGRSLKTHLDRGLQLLVESQLRQGLRRYAADAGEVIVMDPTTGAILALAALPNFDPNHYSEFLSAAYRLPAIAETYEPGSTFKLLVLAAALNEAVVTPETTCDQACQGPVKIGPYTIKTWDNQYHPGQTVSQILARSDNVGMVYLARLLGQAQLSQYLEAFGIGQPSGVDLEGETVVPLRQSWGEIDLATAAFGQGVAVNSLQMLAAVNAIAAAGQRFQPQVVASLIEPDGNQVNLEPRPVNQVLRPETAKIMTELMVGAVAHGEAKWSLPQGYRLAGKTGTAQIPISGHYDQDKTIASFIGFAPADQPRFAMLVKLREPQTSPWASETAAPLWFNLAQAIFVYLNIPPS